MTAEQYLRNATRTIYDAHTRDEVKQELESCIEDLTQSYLKQGMSLQEATESAVKQMGKPEETSMEFHKIYRPKVNWKEIVWFASWTIVIGALNFLGIFLILVHYPTVIRLFGIFLMGFGIFWSAAEKYMDLPFFYAWADNWDGGGLVNAGMIGAIGTGLAARNILELIVLGVLMLVIYQGQRLFISHKREREEQKYLWEICIAQEDFNFQGKVTIGKEIKKVRIEKGTLVKKGDALIITGINGFRLKAEKWNP